MKSGVKIHVVFLNHIRQTKLDQLLSLHSFTLLVCQVDVGGSVSQVTVCLVHSHTVLPQAFDVLDPAVQAYHVSDALVELLTNRIFLVKHDR